MSVSALLSILFFGLIVAGFAYGFGMKRGEKDAKEGVVYRDEDDNEM